MNEHQAEPQASFSLNTTSASFLHWLLPFPRKLLPRPVIYIVGLVIALLPLIIAALFSAAPESNSQLTFFTDLNILFAFSVSFPTILLLTVTDQEVLESALRTVQCDGTVTFKAPIAQELQRRWRMIFRYANIGAQALAVLFGLFIAWINYNVYAPSSVGFWISSQDSLLPVGYVFLYAIGALYALIVVYISRSICIALLFRAIVKEATIQLLPMHPDQSGGLRPVGSLGLRNQYVLMLLGINIALLVAITVHYLHAPASMLYLIGAAVVGYLFLGPLVFVAPLLPFRNGMLQTKADLMSDVARRVRLELQRMRISLQKGSLTKEDEELIDRLRKIGALIEELPVWPFDASTLRKFLVSYIIPVVGTLGLPAAKFLYELVKSSIER